MPTEDKNGNLHGDNSGKFVSKGTTESETKGYNSQDRDGNIFKNARSAAKKSISKEEFFGEEFTGVDGKEAIEKLLKEKRGHVKNAFERQEIGGIDLVWGDKNGGLLHTILKRDKLFEKGKGSITGIDMVRKIPEIIQRGEFNQDDDGRLNIDYDGYRVGLTPKYFEQKVNWIVTAMERWK